MALTLGMVTTDATDAVELARWWADQVGAEVSDDYDGWFVMVRGGDLPVVLGFQKVEEVTPGKNRMHLDLSAEDLDGAVERLVAAGAGLVGERGSPEFRWVTLTDPHGNQFDVAESSEAASALGG